MRREALGNTSTESVLQTLVEDKDGDPGVPTVHVSSYPVPLEFSREPNSPLVPSRNSQGGGPQDEDSNSKWRSYAMCCPSPEVPA